jgi:hypothetical protein
MVKEKDCQAWTNYETWAIAHHINNTKEIQERWLANARECRAHARDHDNVIEGAWTEAEAARIALADTLKEEADDGLEWESVPLPYRVLLVAAFNNVNWIEIAESLLKTIQEQDQAK